MQKANVIRSDFFHMDSGDVLHMLFLDETGTPVTITLNSVSTDGEDNRELPPDAPVALDASDITATTFSANVNLMENTLGFYLDVATDSAFTSFVAGFNNLDIGLVTTYPVTGLSNAQTYYTRFRGYNDYGTGESSNVITTLTDMESVVDADGNIYTYVTIGTQQWMVENLKTTKYADGVGIPNIIPSEYGDWFLPSKDELLAMYDELKVHGVGGFTTDGSSYWSSSESFDAFAWAIRFSDRNADDFATKSGTLRVRACRTFTAGIGDYSLRDTGPGSGLIFHIAGTTYYEAAPSDTSASQAWSNVTAIASGATDTAIGKGLLNTLTIIFQGGHVTSAAKLCDDLEEGGWISDTIGAYCYYDNDIANKADYGALYNKYAVDNAHGLAPTGWRVAKDADYNTLIAYLGGASIAGGFLKEMGLAHWLTPNTSATDTYGFKALGSGNRSDDGSFTQLNEIETFWCTDGGSTAYNLYYNSALLFGIDAAGVFGFSVRCMRDVV